MVPVSLRAPAAARALFPVHRSAQTPAHSKEAMFGCPFYSYQSFDHFKMSLEIDEMA